MRDRAAVSALLRADAASAARDPLLLALLLATPLLVLLLRFGYPLASSVALARWGVDLDPYRPFALGALLVIDLPMNAGAILALLVLDERDDGTVTAIGVTPLGLGGYVGYRFTSAVVLATLLPAVSLPLTGLLPLAQLRGAVPALLPALLIGPLAGCVVLLLATNKVDGLAVMKGAGLVWVLPLAGWFVDGWWTPLLWLIPTGAAVEVLWIGVAGGTTWPAAVLATGWTGLLLALVWPRVRLRLAEGGR